MKKQFWVLIVILGVLSVGCSSSITATQESASIKQLTPATTVVKAITPNQDDVNNVCLLLTQMGQEHFDHYEIYYAEDSFFVNIATDGFAEYIIDIKNAGYDDTYEVWVSMKNEFLSLYSTQRKLLDELGFEKSPLLMNVVNDLNHENTLLSIAYDFIIYDCMAD